ncbi:MAG: PAS domain S-box protein [bacterium]
MEDFRKTKKQLIVELEALRVRMAELERGDASSSMSAGGALKESEASDCVFFDSTNDAIFIHEMETGRIIDVNKRMCEMWGYTREEALRLDVGALSAGIPPYTQEKALEWIKKAVQGESPVFEWLPKDRHGNLFWVEVNLKRASTGHKERVLAIARDITERKRAEEALRKSEAKYRELVQSANSIILRMDPKGNVTFFNEFAQSFFGYTEDEMIGQDVVGTIVPETDESGRDLRAMIEDIGRNPEKYTSNENQNMRRSGERIWVAWTNKAIFDESGRIAEILCIGNDITERKSLEDQLRQAQKMESIGQLAGGVAHDFNNLLTGIIGNLSLAELDAPVGLRRCLTGARHAADRAANLVKQLPAFSRKSAVDLRSADLNKIVNESYRLVRETIDRRIEIVVQTEEELPQVRCDAAQINSVLMNLCGNARDAISEVLYGRTASERRGEQFAITIKTESLFVDHSYCETHTYAKPGQVVVLSVSDNGPGMDLETQRHVFEPFFTTKELGRGTGLGLASSYGIIKQHNGWIDLLSEPGKGTTFKVYLPLGEGEIQKDESVPQEDVSGGTETILLIDDEEIIRDVGQAILKQYGYTVLLARDGREGLVKYLNEQDRIDLIILDLSMPNLSGQEMLEHLRTSDTSVKVIISSGYSKDAQRDSLDQLGVVGYTAKPYNPIELARTVRQALDTS